MGRPPKEVNEIKVPTIIDEDIVRNLKDVDDLPDEAGGMIMDKEGLFQSMKNAIMILPPNLLVNGRHTIENISSLVGYRITESQWDRLYESEAT